MGLKRIITTLEKGKPIRIHVEGACGTECQALTEPLEQALGARLSEELTDDYYKEPEQELTQEQ